MNKRKPKWLVAFGCAVLLCFVLVSSYCKLFLTSKNCSVLLISVDTLRADRLNCYGFKRHITSPNIDSLARDGILFENCITASPWTIPAHMSMLTSLHPSTHGMTIPFHELFKDLYHISYDLSKLPESRTTLAEVLKTNGFTTAAFTGGGTLEPVIGFGQGFDLYDTSMVKLGDHNMSAMYDWIKQNWNRQFFLFWHHFEVHAPYLHGDFLSGVLPKESADQVRDIHAE